MAAAPSVPVWHGDYRYLVENLVSKDFKIRYRNMSLGLLWSIANPLVMMGVLTFVFTVLMPNGQKNFPVFLLCGLVPFNFFSIAWSTGTTSVTDSANLLKRLSFPREIVPLSSVLGNCVHFAIQLGILLLLTLGSGLPVTIHWLWLPVIIALEIIFVMGLAMLTGSINVYIRDTRYAVESLVTIIFWLVPVVYSFERIPEHFKNLYLNPIAAVIMAFLPMSAICLENVSKIYSRTAGRELLRKHITGLFRPRRHHEQFYALKDVSFRVDHSESVAVLGTTARARARCSV